ncbi:hypothetical protein BGX38DRAFT_1256947 [Terfezia claveryi]|nr:hypothetical protein BGX38DRAFT_1256947 [Terfezia claveryi]
MAMQGGCLNYPRRRASATTSLWINQIAKYVYFCNLNIKDKHLTDPGVARVCGQVLTGSFGVISQGRYSQLPCPQHCVGGAIFESPFALPHMHIPPSAAGGLIMIGQERTRGLGTLVLVLPVLYKAFDENGGTSSHSSRADFDEHPVPCSRRARSSDLGSSREGGKQSVQTFGYALIRRYNQYTVKVTVI